MPIRMLRNVRFHSGAARKMEGEMDLGLIGVAPFSLEGYSSIHNLLESSFELTTGYS